MKKILSSETDSAFDKRLGIHSLSNEEFRQLSKFEQKILAKAKNSVEPKIYFYGAIDALDLADVKLTDMFNSIIDEYIQNYSYKDRERYDSDVQSSTAIKSSAESRLTSDQKALLSELESMGVKGKIMFNRSSNRGFDVSSGEANLMIYVPEEMYSKELKQTLEDLIGQYGWFPKLERRGRDNDGNIKLRVW